MKTKKSKHSTRPVQWVQVDTGYGPMEHWTQAKVIDERTCRALFGDGTTTNLLVEFPGGERTWVSFWSELKDVKTGVAAHR
jgi:hypothetical protein